VNRIVAACLVLAALVHFPPVAGIAGAEMLSGLYGVAIDDPSIVLLMRHRAVLFGVLGALLVAGAFVRSLRTFALIAGFVSVVSFLVLAAGVEPRSAAIQKIWVADWIALGFLVIAAAIELRTKRHVAPAATGAADLR